MLQDERLIELLSGSLDGVLTAEENTELESLLAGSAEARELLAEMTADGAALKALPELKVPDNLKQRALLKARARGGASGAPWRRMMMAASLFLVVGVGLYTFRPIGAIRNRLHLRPGQLAVKAAEISEELSVAAESSKGPHVLLSDAVSGRYNGGQAHCRFKCDAGTEKGARVKVQLAFDFDGDGQFDAHSKPRIMEVDEKVGYQEMACDWADLEGMQDLKGGKVKVELSKDGNDGPPLRVQFEPEQASLDLPYDALLPPGEAAT